MLKAIFFDEIIRDNKIKFLDNKQDYDFTNKIDGSILGREKELEIEIITPNYVDYDKLDIIKAQTMGSASMKMILPLDAVFMKDLKMYLRTHKYVKQSQSTTNRPEVKRILQDKGQQNADRRRNLLLIANKLMATSTVIMNGQKHEMGQNTEGKTRVVNAFQDLIKIVYSNLRMLGSVQYSEDTIKQVIRDKQDALFGADDKSMSEAESEIINLIKRRKKQSDRTSLNDLKTHFLRKPYGWYPNAIWTISAKLYKRGKLELKQDTNLLDDDRVLNALLNSAYHANTLLEPQATFDVAMVKKLKQTYADAFDENCALTEAKDVANAFKERLKEMQVELGKLLAKRNSYPFISGLSDFNEKLYRWSTKEYSYYLTNISDFEDDLLDTKEDLLDPIKRFMNGDQVQIYDAIHALLNGDRSNLDYIEGNEFKTLENLLAHPKPYTGNLIREAKAAKEELSKKVLNLIEEEKTSAIATVEKTIKVLQSKDEYKNLESGKQNIIVRPLQDEMQKLHNQKYIAIIRDIKHKVKDRLLEQQLNEMIRLSTPIKEEAAKKDGAPVVHDPIPHYIRKSAVKVNFSKTELRSETDVQEYIEAYKKALLKEIKNNRRISL